MSDEILDLWKQGKINAETIHDLDRMFRNPSIVDAVRKQLLSDHFGARITRALIAGGYRVSDYSDVDPRVLTDMLSVVSVALAPDRELRYCQGIENKSIGIFNKAVIAVLTDKGKMS